MKPLRVLLLLVAGMLSGLSATHAKEIVGYAEKARIYPQGLGEAPGLDVRTRIDTGANLASLHCNCITPIKRDGEDWVSFTVTNYAGDMVRLERPVDRVVTIKRHFGESQERFVIKLGICLGSQYRETEVSLIDRKGLTYPMLLGRAFMGSDFLVDTSETYINEPKCEAPAE